MELDTSVAGAAEALSSEPRAGFAVATRNGSGTQVLTRLLRATISRVDLTGVEPVTPGWKARWRRTCEALSRRRHRLADAAFSRF